MLQSAQLIGQHWLVGNNESNPGAVMAVIVVYTKAELDTADEEGWAKTEHTNQ